MPSSFDKFMKFQGIPILFSTYAEFIMSTISLIAYFTMSEQCTSQSKDIMFIAGFGRFYFCMSSLVVALTCTFHLTRAGGWLFMLYNWVFNFVFSIYFVVVLYLNHETC